MVSANFLVLNFFLIIGTNTCACAYASYRETGNCIVKTESGLVRGVPSTHHSAITVFKGIPYAAPPVGPLRWREPHPVVKPWEGVRLAANFSSECIQVDWEATVSTGAEDCLYLNIWTGALRKIKKGKKKKLLPVYVWIHGGAYCVGSGSELQYDGTSIAQKGLIFVTLNYRLNVMGFLAMPELSRESGHNSSGNYGLLDQIAALKWIQRNIAAFGGNPKRVTVGGQSAGGGSCLILTLSPLTKGLFHQSIPESGGIFYPHDPEISSLPTAHRSLEYAEKSGVLYAKQHGALKLEDLRAMNAKDIVVNGSARDYKIPVTWNGYPPLFHPVLDGYVIARTYEETLNLGLQNKIPVLTGNNKDEWGGLGERNTTLSRFMNISRGKYGEMADEFLSLYPASNDAEAAHSTNAAIRDNSRVSTFLWSNEWLKHTKKRLFTYFWTHAQPAKPSLGASHDSEKPYFLNNLYILPGNWTKEDYWIAEIMSSYVANFVKHGDPNGPGLPKWPRSNGEKQFVMEIGDNFTPIPLTNGTAKLDFIQRFYAKQRPW